MQKPSGLNLPAPPQLTFQVVPAAGGHPGSLILPSVVPRCRALPRALRLHLDHQGHPLVLVSWNRRARPSAFDAQTAEVLSLLRPLGCLSRPLNANGVYTGLGLGMAWCWAQVRRESTGSESRLLISTADSLLRGAASSPRLKSTGSQRQDRPVSINLGCLKRKSNYCSHQGFKSQLCRKL